MDNGMLTRICGSRTEEVREDGRNFILYNLHDQLKENEMKTA
jgi:hypothetical protein